MMIILCLEINYYSPNPKITPISVIYITLDFTKTHHVNFRNIFQLYLPFPESPIRRWEKGRLKMIAPINKYLTRNT